MLKEQPVGFRNGAVACGVTLTLNILPNGKGITKGSSVKEEHKRTCLTVKHGWRNTDVGFTGRCVVMPGFGLTCPMGK